MEAGPGRCLGRRGAWRCGNPIPTGLSEEEKGKSPSWNYTNSFFSRLW